jgi:hypothetical protein
MKRKSISKRMTMSMFIAEWANCLPIEQQQDLLVDLVRKVYHTASRRTIDRLLTPLVDRPRLANKLERLILTQAREIRSQTLARQMSGNILKCQVRPN